MEKILNFIGGKLVEPQSGKYFDNFMSAEGRKYGLTPDSNERDVAMAVAAAKGAFSSWSGLSVEKRCEYLKKFAGAIDKNLERLARAESIDSGKPLSLARELEIPRAKTNFEFFSDFALDFKGETFHTEKRALNKVVYLPLGVVALISPWNMPLYLLTWKIAPALAAGNTVVAKPSEVTPMTAFMLSQIAIEIGLPAGVLNIVHGTGPSVGAPLVTHVDIRAISFTGSTVTGRTIAKSAAPALKKVSLELGGKNPNIIFSDCDFDKALETTVRSAFQNSGQICLCGSRILIEKSLYPKFRDALVERTRSLKMGDPLDEATQQGAVVSESHMNKILGYLDMARKDGQVLIGGRRANLAGRLARGYFIEPTIVEGLSWEHKFNQEEIFGPVASLIPFESETEAIQIANGTPYGLAASVWSQDLAKAERVARAVEVGTAWVNTWMLRDLRVPFGGTKESGVGREGGADAMRFFSEVKTICVSH